MGVWWCTGFVSTPPTHTADCQGIRCLSYKYFLKICTNFCMERRTRHVDLKFADRMPKAILRFFSAEGSSKKRRTKGSAYQTISALHRVSKNIQCGFLFAPGHVTTCRLHQFAIMLGFQKFWITWTLPGMRLFLWWHVWGIWNIQNVSEIRQVRQARDRYLKV